MPAIGKSEDRLRHVLRPLYMQLFNLIGQLEGGVKFLVDLRADLIVSLFIVLYSSWYISTVQKLPYEVQIVFEDVYMKNSVVRSNLHTYTDYTCECSIREFLLW